MIGMSPRERSVRQTSSPSMPGSMRSSSTTSIAACSTTRQRHLAGRRFDDGTALVGQREPERQPDALVVLHHQQPDRPGPLVGRTDGAWSTRARGTHRRHRAAARRSSRCAARRCSSSASAPDGTCPRSSRAARPTSSATTRSGQPPGERTRELSHDGRVRPLAGVRAIHLFLLLPAEVDPSCDRPHRHILPATASGGPVDELAGRRACRCAGTPDGHLTIDGCPPSATPPGLHADLCTAAHVASVPDQTSACLTGPAPRIAKHPFVDEHPPITTSTMSTPSRGAAQHAGCPGRGQPPSHEGRGGRAA